MHGSQQPPMAAAVAAIVSHWRIRENAKSDRPVAAIARCVGCAPPQKPAERPSRELRSAGYAHRCHLYRAPTLAGAAVHPQASDDWIESEVGLSWRRAPGLYPKRHGWSRGVVMAELDIRYQRIWSQTRVPVILHQGTGKPLLVRVPYAQDNRPWIRGDCRNQPTWDAARKQWETPRAWFNRLIDQALERHGQVYVVQCIRNCRSARRPAGTPRATTVSAPAWAPTTAAGTLAAAGTRSLRPLPFNGGRHSTHVGISYGSLRQDVQGACDMRIEIQHPAFKSKRLSVETASFLAGPKLLLNGVVLKRKGRSYLVGSDSDQELAIKVM
jgi:hypothetical protein